MHRHRDLSAAEGDHCRRADECLDVVVQRQVMETLKTLGKALGASIILIGHDMGLMAQAVDRLGVMYARRPRRDGQRRGSSAILHPYTRLLIASLPTLDRKEASRESPD